MKKTIFIIILLLLNVQIGTCQVQSNIVTPKASPVTAYISPEDDSYWRIAWDQAYSQAYSTNTMITTYDDYSSTGRFNCHGYAWYLQGSFTSPRWIGYYYSTDEDIYMSDGSYVQVLNEMYPGKVSWGSGDHSAMTTSTSGVWVSKWNRYPLFQHAYNNTPYGTSNLKYYVPTSITGSSLPLCNSSSREFTARSIPNASYSWNIGSGLTKSENGNSCTVYSNSYYTGLSWIEVTITSPIGGGQNDVKTSPKLYFWLGIPAPWITGPSSGEVGNSYYFYVHTDDLQYAYSNVDWGLSPNYEGNSIYDYDYCANAYFYAEQEQSYQISATVQNTCGSGNTTHYIDIYYYGGYLLTPNPASSEVTISVINPDQSLNLSKNIFDVSIFNMNGILQVKRKYSGERFSIPVYNLKDGSYIISIDNGKSVVNKQLIVKH
jgi:hypothetical protein